MNNTQKINLAVKISLIVVASILALAILAVGGFVLFDRIRHGSFYKDAEREFVIPGLNENYTPQGFDYLEEHDTYVCCGYMSDGTASRIYLITADYKSSDAILIKNADGSDFLGHAGGITAMGDHVYLTDDNCILMLSLADIMNGDGTATVADSFPVSLDPAYCTVYGGNLYVGSYYYPEKYETPEHERMVTPAGDQNYAIMAVYPLDAESGKPTQALPTAFYSTRGMVQGMEFVDEDTIILSTSWGLNTSHLYCYDLSAVTPVTAVAIEQRTTEGDSVAHLPLYYLDSSNCFADIVAPCMSEEIVCRDGRIYIMSEAASNKYFFGKLLGANRLYSYPIPKKEAK